MPGLYAHYTFGQKVKKMLPEEIQICIDLYKDEFDLGLQGPDVLFFYRAYRMNPTRHMGHKIHKKPMACYMRNMLPLVEEKGLYSPECAYLLGFVCHFMLDSGAHPYVNQKKKETKIGHIELEGEFEKYLMYRDWVRPEQYPIWRHVPVSASVRKTVETMYPWVAGRRARASVLYFHYCKWLLTAQCGLKKKLLIWGIDKSGKEKKLRGHYIWDDLKEEAIPVSEGFVEIYEKEIKKAAAMEQRVWKLIQGEELGKYPARFRKNFDGVIPE